MKSSVKVTLIEQVLQSNIARKKTNRVTIRQFINRLLLLFQEPRIFIFYERNKDTSQWEYAFDTHRDVFYRDVFKKTVLAKINNDKGVYIQPGVEAFGKCSYVEAWPESPLEINNTGYGVVIIAITSDKDGMVKFASPIVYHLEKKIYNKDYHLLNMLWSSFIDYDFSKALGVDKKLQEVLMKIKKAHHGDAFQKLNTQELELHDEFDRSLMDYQLVIQKEMINMLYEDLSETPLIRNKNKIPPNLFFFVRYYDDPGTVNRSHLDESDSPAYPYTLRIVIPERQKKDLQQAFKVIAQSKPYGNKDEGYSWNYDYDGMSEINSCFPNRELDIKFWNKLHKAKEKNKLDEVINNMLIELEKPFGQGARSFVDPALVSGFVHFKKGVYRNGGVERLRKSVMEKGFRSTDVKRLVYLHYILSAAAPDSSYRNLGTMTVPLNVVKQPYVALVQATVDTSNDKFSWPHNYHFFSDVSRHCVRKIRYNSKRLYRAQLSEQIYNTVIDGFRFHHQEIKLYFPFALMEKQINHRLKLLCRVWPYPLLQIKFRSNVNVDDIDKEDDTLLIFNSISKGIVIDFFLRPNPFFDSNNDAESLKKSEESASVYLSSYDVRKDVLSAVRRLDETLTRVVLTQKLKEKMAYDAR